jgi:hypothetical protein
MLPGLIAKLGLTVWLLARPGGVVLGLIITYELLGLAASAINAHQIGQWGPPVAGLLVCAIMRSATLGYAIAAIAGEALEQTPIGKVGEHSNNGAASAMEREIGEKPACPPSIGILNHY